MLKTELKIETVGKPDITVLPNYIQNIFFETLLAHIKELNEKGTNEQLNQD